MNPNRSNNNQLEENTFYRTVHFLWINRRTIITATLVSAVLSLIISFLLPVKYKAIATFYPAKAQDLVINDSGVKRGNFGEFGEEEEAEQMLELMASENFKMEIVDVADLFNHYEIDPGSMTGRSDMLLAYDGNVSSSRTKYNAIQVEVIDKSPEKSAEIANAITDHVDLFRNEVVRTRTDKTLHYVEGQMDSLQGRMNADKTRLAELNEMGVISRDERVGLYQALGEASTSRAALQNQIAANQKYGSEYDLIDNRLLYYADDYQNLENRIIQLRAESSPDNSYKFEVQRASKPEKKAKPKRSIVVIVGTLLGLIIVILILLYRDRWPKLRDKLESQEY